MRLFARVVYFRAMQTELNDESLRASWDAKAHQWHQQVGADGDANRRYNSDPVLWRMLGDVAGCDVLDLGCGTGYLAIKLAFRGARVVGVDHSPAMIEVARRNASEARAEVRLEVCSAADLAPFDDAQFDCVACNYVLMDVADMRAVVREAFRVLRPGGSAAFVFSHPCFTPSAVVDRLADGSVRYRWDRSYFDEYQYEESWGHFTTPFAAFHRPLSAYWKAFTEAGFAVQDFEEPVASAHANLELDFVKVQRMRMRPYSVAFLLRRP